MDVLNSLQLASAVMMVRPAHFGYNPDTGRTNAFQNVPEEASFEEISARAVLEFDRMTDALRSSGIDVVVFEDDSGVVCPDAVFPNNWITMHADGTIVTYPMESPSRRPERRDDIINGLMEHFSVKRKFNLEIFEEKGQFLEGTGSMIFDHDNRVVYACLSPRTDVQVLSHLGGLLKYEPVFFRSRDHRGVPVYHTNVMMAMGVGFVIACMESLDGQDRKMLESRFAASNKEIIEISFGQMNSFAGNMLQLRSVEGRRILVMSQTAYASLDAAQVVRLRAHTDLLPVEIPNIEKIGGGSARCMMAEIFLPRKSS